MVGTPPERRPMSNRKNSVLLYTDDMEILEDLTLEQRGVLLTAILSYQAGAELPEMDSITKVAFKFMKKQIDANNQAYEETCEKRKHAADSRWRKEKCDADKAENSTTKSSATANAKAASKLNEPERKEAAETKAEKQDAEESEQDTNEDNASAFLGNAKHANAFSDDANNASAFFACRKNANAWENDNDNDKDKENEKDKENDIDIEKEKDIDIDIDKCAVPLSNINNIYSAREENESSTARSESPPEEAKEIVDAWNACANTITVKDIIPHSQRDSNLKLLVKRQGFDEVLRTVKDFDSNLYFTQSNKVGFDWFLKPQNYQKVIEGNYKELWTKPKPRQGNNKFKNFTQRSNDDVYAQLEKVIYD